jgi:hypothetical protein
VILLVLGFSALMNLVLTSNETMTWWKERRASGFMRRVGVEPNVMMSRAIYIADIAEASTPSSRDLPYPQNSTCFSTFRELLDGTDLNAPWEDAGASMPSSASKNTARRLRRTRQRLGSYRHDLLVAMRVVNSVEREVIQSEWENWLAQEKSLCDDLDVVLTRDESDKANKNAGGKQKKLKTSTSSEWLSPDRRKSLEAWRDGHCGSCRSDYRLVAERDGQVSGL